MNPQQQLQSIEVLLDLILKIPGEKIVTLASENKIFTIDIQADGQMGYQKGHEQLFIFKLRRALLEGGGMSIRQFLPIKVSRKLANGEKIWIPEKNLYSVVLCSGEWRGLTAEDVQQMHETDAATGQPLSKEEGVHYQTFPSL